MYATEIVLNPLGKSTRSDLPAGHMTTKTISRRGDFGRRGNFLPIWNQTETFTITTLSLMIDVFAKHNIALVHLHHAGQIRCPEFLPESSAAELLTCANLLRDQEPLHLFETVDVLPLQHCSDCSSLQLFLFCRSADSCDSFGNGQGMNNSFFHGAVNFARRSFLLSDCLPRLWFSKNAGHSWFWAHRTKILDSLSELFPRF